VAREAVVPTAPGSVVPAGGLAPGDVTTARTVRLHLLDGRAHPLPPLAVPVHDTAAGLVARRPTVIGGGNTAEQATVQSLARGRWREVGRLPSTRSDLSVVDWQHRAYVIGGYDGTTQPTGILRLTSSGPPHRAGALAHGVRYAATARLGPRVFVIGGEVDGRELDTIQRVDLTTGRTRPTGRLPVPLGHAMAAAVGGRILVMGGRTGPGQQSDRLWWFDPGSRRLHPAGRLPTPLSDAAVATAGRRIWLLGGETPQTTDRVTALTVH
jgi:N-acetylneuraminic acid mutarotase